MVSTAVCAAAIREQDVEIVDFSTREKLCSVKAGPKTAISDIMNQIVKNLGIELRQLRLSSGDYKFKENDRYLGASIFKEAEKEQVQPELQLKRLTGQEADQYEGRLEAIDRMKNHGEHLKMLEELWRSDDEVVLWAIEHLAPTELQHASDSVKGHHDTMVEAMKLSTLCMYYVSDNLWQDREFMKSCVAIDGMLLGAQMVPSQWREDVEIVMIACERHGYALKFASEELKNNRSVVFAAVNQRGTALMYASEELREDHYVVLDAVRNNKMAIVHALGGLREDDAIRAAAGQKPSDVKMIAKIEKIKKKFHELDANGDGFLSYEELESLLRKGNPDLPDDEIKLLYEGMDTHHDGRVDFHEFCDYIFSEDV